MVVGEAGSGKSTNVTVLAKALSRLHSDGVKDRDGFYKQVDRLLLNPKSITAGEPPMNNRKRRVVDGWEETSTWFVLRIVTLNTLHDQVRKMGHESTTEINS